jgi:hypothetical protein
MAGIAGLRFEVKDRATEHSLFKKEKGSANKPISGEVISD